MDLMAALMCNMLPERTPEGRSCLQLVVQGVPHLQASCWVAFLVLPSLIWLILLCALCCRASTFHEPVKAFICEMLPEHMRETSRMQLVYDDFGRLSASEIEEIAEWLWVKVEGLIKMHAEPEVGPRLLATMTPKEAGAVLSGWLLPHSHGMLGHVSVLTRQTKRWLGLTLLIYLNASAIGAASACKILSLARSANVLLGQTTAGVRQATW